MADICSEYEAADHLQKSKRKKFDKDGFVTPATPEMLPVPTDSAVSNKNHHQEHTVLPEEGQVYLSEEPAEKCSEKHPNSEQISLMDLLKEQDQQMKILTMNWSQNLSDSENFELLLPTRLDKLIQEAKNLEKALNGQKDQLRNRLKTLSNTLQV